MPTVANGAPFGKYNQAPAWLVSFLNVVDRIASCNENHLICGANCSEEHPTMVEYGRQIRKDIERIEKKAYAINGISVTFYFELVPSDMKWLAFISGELPNSAKYFLSFANVSKDDIAKVGCTYGGPSDDFQPWDYKNRLKIANSVAKFKSKLTQKQLAARTKVTEFIANQKLRQEFEPILGPLIDKGFAESLHLANNNWQFLFLELFEYILHSKTAVPSSCKEISDLQVGCCLRKFLSCLKNEVKVNRLHNAILHWFREGRKGGAAFTLRFTGEQTKRMCNGFAN